MGFHDWAGLILVGGMILMALVGIGGTVAVEIIEVIRECAP